MAEKNPDVIKEIVRGNFDRSAEHYEHFEHDYGLFEYLTLKLAVACNIHYGMYVCDIGCGTGSSTFVLEKIVGHEGKVFGIDSSEKMLEMAQRKQAETQKQTNQMTKYNSCIEYIQCDADDIEENVGFKLDSVLYNASIFLIPSPDTTLQCTYRLLKKNGTVGMNYLIGVFDKDLTNNQSHQVRNAKTQNQPIKRTRNAGSLLKSLPNNDLFKQTKQDGKEFAPYGRQIMDTKDIGKILKKTGFKNIQNGMISRKMAPEEMITFYSIPAQSAALYPKTQYKERREMIKSLIKHIQNRGVDELYQYWGWCVGVKA